MKHLSTSFSFTFLLPYTPPPIKQLRIFSFFLFFEKKRICQEREECNNTDDVGGGRRGTLPVGDEAEEEKGGREERQTALPDGEDRLLVLLLLHRLRRVALHAGIHLANSHCPKGEERSANFFWRGGRWGRRSLSGLRTTFHLPSAFFVLSLSGVFFNFPHPSFPPRISNEIGARKARR